VNSDEFANAPSGGEVVAASDGFEAVEGAESRAFADE
jgi:hypothetical protein